MNRKTNLILLVLVLVAVAYLMFLRNPKATAPSDDTTAEETTTRRLISVDSADVTKLAITPADEKPVVLERKDGQWYLTEPVKGKAERFAVDDLLTGITQLQSRGQAGKADTGLNPPRYRIELGLKDGKTVKLAIGARSALGDTMFVQLEGALGVDVVPADLDTKLAEPVSKLRDQRLTDTTSAEIRQVVINGPGGRIAMHKAGEAWEMTEPQKMPVEPSEATDITSQLSNLRAVEFVNEDGAGAARYQLAEPQMSVWFSTQAPATQPAASQPSGVTLNLGRYDGPEKRNVYANLSTSPGVVKVSATVLNALKKKPYELRDRKVMDVDPATVNRVAITSETPAATQPATREASRSTLVVVRNEAAGLQGPPTPGDHSGRYSSGDAGVARDVGDGGNAAGRG